VIESVGLIMMDDTNGTRSNMLVNNVAFVNFTGYLDGKSTTASVSCSTRQPCYNIDYKNYTLYTSSNKTSTGTASCKWIAEGGVHGVKC